MSGLASQAADGSRLQRPPYISLVMASAVALAYEIHLTRLFAIIQWHHFAYMVISLALLGYGFSGTVLALWRETFIRRIQHSYPACLGLFALSVPTCFLLAQSVSLHPEALLWRPDLYWRLLVIYLLLAVPFFFVALAVVILLTRFGMRAGSVYAADLVGAGLGSILIIVALFWFLPVSVLWALTILAALAALMALAELRSTNLPVAALAVFTLVLPLLVPSEHAGLKISPFKTLPQTMTVSGAQLLGTRSSPLGLISIVGNPVVPFRYAPDLSLNAQVGPPDQIGVFIDGDRFSPINAWSGDPGETAWLNASTSALAYHLVAPRRILISGAGGGSEVLRALGAFIDGLSTPHLDVLESNMQIAGLVKDDFAAFSGDIYRRAGVHVHHREPREWLARNIRHYDLITFPAQGGPGGSGGLSALGENYEFTVEAFVQYLESLTDQGFLSLTSWLQLPPRDTLKVFATAVTALKQVGVEEVADRLIVIRGWQTATLLVKGSAVSPAEIDGVRAFCQQHGFDLVFYKGMAAREANRINRLRRPEYHEGTVALAGPAFDDFIARYKFDIAPATDDRPYFFQFFRWRSLPEFLTLRGSGGLGLLESGFVLLLATLVQAMVLALLFVLLPLIVGGRRSKTRRAPWRGRVVAYFSLLGLAFMFIEIAFIQKFVLFLHHPVYSVTTVLAGFLVFAGAGSASAARLNEAAGRTALPVVVAGIALLGLSYLALAPFFQAFFSGFELPVRIVMALCLLAPLAFLMGIPFPLGVMRLAGHEPQAVPWAWAVNGSASVISAVLATVLAMHLGFTTVVLSALIMYVLCVTVAPPAGTAKREGPDCEA